MGVADATSTHAPLAHTAVSVSPAKSDGAGHAAPSDAGTIWQKISQHGVPHDVFHGTRICAGSVNTHSSMGALALAWYVYVALYGTSPIPEYVHRNAPQPNP